MAGLCRNILSVLRRQLLLVCTLVGATVGLALGFGFRELQPSDDVILWIGMPGEIFIRMLKALVVPLVVSSIISGSASLDPSSSGKLSGLAIGYSVLCNLIGSVLGVIVFYIFLNSEDRTSTSTSSSLQKDVKLSTHDMFADLLRNIFPSNMVSATFEKSQTKYRLEERILNDDNATVIQSYVRYTSASSGANILGLIVISLAMGLAAGKLGDKSKPFLHVFEALTEITLVLIKWVVSLTPVGVASLIGKALIVEENLRQTFSSVGIFIAALCVAVLFHHIVLVPIIYSVTFHKLPFIYMLTSVRPIVTGMAPPSSAIVIPDLCRVAETKYGVDKRVSRFVIPLGATTNRLGSAIFISLSVLFLNMSDGKETELPKIIIVILLTTIGALGVPAVASASIVIIIIIVTQLGISTQSIGMLIAVDWFNDRVRTTNNITANLFGSLLIYKLSKETLQKLDSENITKQEISRESNETQKTQDGLVEMPLLLPKANDNV